MNYAETIKSHLTRIPLFHEQDEVAIEHTRKYHEAAGISYSARLAITGPRGGVRFEQVLTLEDVQRWMVAMGEVQAHLLAQEAGQSIYDGQRNFARAKQLLQSVVSDLPEAA